MLSAGVFRDRKLRDHSVVASVRTADDNGITQLLLYNEVLFYFISWLVKRSGWICAKVKVGEPKSGPKQGKIFNDND